jgi:transcriptional regulator with XRE-family HTH domain
VGFVTRIRVVDIRFVIVACGIMPAMENLAQRLKSEREKRGLSQWDLATRAGVGQSTIASLERDPNRSTTKLVQIARALNVTPQWLETGKGPKDPPPSSNTPYIAADSIEDLAIKMVDKGAAECSKLFDLVLQQISGRK